MDVIQTKFTPMPSSPTAVNTGPKGAHVVWRQPRYASDFRSFQAYASVRLPKYSKYLMANAIDRPSVGQKGIHSHHSDEIYTDAIKPKIH